MINNDQYILHICDDAQGSVPLYFKVTCTCFMLCRFIHSYPILSVLHSS